MRWQLQTMDDPTSTHSRPGVITFDRDRFKAVVHYVIWICEDPRSLGPVKLNRVLWYADRNAYLLHGEPLAGATYVKRPYGPLARALAPVIRELEQESAVAARVRSHNVNMEQYFARHAPRLTGLRPEHIGVLEAATRSVCFDQQAPILNKKAHDRVWRVARVGEVLPFFTVFAGLSGDMLDADMDWALREAHRGRFHADWKEMEELRGVNPAIENACKALVWFLSREPSAGMPIGNGGSSTFIYKQKGHQAFNIPDICVIYRFDLEELVLGSFRYTFYGAEDEDADGEELEAG